MRNQIKIEGGGKGGWEPNEVYEKNLGFITDTTVIHLGKPMSWKTMQENFIFTAPIMAAHENPYIKTWNDRNTDNADTKLSPETPFKKIKPLPNQRKSLPDKPLSPGRKRIRGDR